MPIKCKKHHWGCHYHACMTDHCQKKVVKEQGIDFGPGLCDKKNEPKNLTGLEAGTQCQTLKFQP